MGIKTVAVAASLLIFGTAALIAAFTPTEQIHRFSSSPAAHESLIFLANWDRPVPHSDEPSETKCDTEDALGASQCRQVFDFPDLPSDAYAALLRVKAKAWNRPSNIPSYCLLYASAYGTEANFSNHFVHVEEWSGGVSGTEERRRIEYTNFTLPVGVHAGLSIGKEVVGRCEVEFAVYLEGYLFKRSPINQVARIISSFVPTPILDAFQYLF